MILSHLCSLLFAALSCNHHCCRLSSILSCLTRTGTQGTVRSVLQLRLLNSVTLERWLHIKEESDPSQYFSSSIQMHCAEPLPPLPITLPRASMDQCAAENHILVSEEIFLWVYFTVVILEMWMFCIHLQFHVQILKQIYRPIMIHSLHQCTDD